MVRRWVAGRARSTIPGAVNNNDPIDLIADLLGRLIIRLNAPRELVVQNSITLTDGTLQTLLAAGAAGVNRDLTKLTFSNTSSTKTRLDVSDGTKIYSWALAADGGGAVLSFEIPWKATNPATAWTAQLSTGVTDVRVAVQAIETT